MKVDWEKTHEMTFNDGIHSAITEIVTLRPDIAPTDLYLAASRLENGSEMSDFIFETLQKARFGQEITL